MMNFESGNTRARFIYGTGTFARDILDVLTRRGLKVNGFLDHSLRQPVIQQLSVTLPDVISLETRAASSIIIGIHNRDANIAAIISRLKALGFTQIITPIDLYDEFVDDLGVRFWLTKRTYYGDYKEEIKLAANLFADEASHDLYNRLIQFRLTGDYSILPNPDLEHQYFPADIPAWKTPLRFVDCGAFDGDTLRDFEKFNIPLEAVAAFEPDQNNFKKLAKYVREKGIPNSFLWPCGVYSSSAQLKFSSGQGEASVISNAGTFAVQCVSLDEAIPNFNPTLIKMDIEGAEIEALRGAQRIIQKYKPGLAISVYHAPAHLWEIPLLVEQMMPGAYRYYLRTHGFNDFDIVLYAIPI